MIRRLAVLGAGTMGAQIAAQFANAGFPVALFDLTRQLASKGLERVRQRTPGAFLVSDAASLIVARGLDEDSASLSDADWIVEAVAERLEAKQSVLALVDAARRPGAIVSTNTSGLPIGRLAEGRSGDFRRHWLGTHFFNPPRYLPLLEIVRGPQSDPPVFHEVSRFCEDRLGKHVIEARDTPGFIANRLGVYGVIRVLDELASGRYTVEEIDEITGPALGRPRSATFRTIDLAGLDVLSAVAGDLAERLTGRGDRDLFALPGFVREMIERGWLGEKAGRGFYERRRGPGGETEIRVLDPARMEYRPRHIPRLSALESAGITGSPEERVARLFAGADRVGEFLRRTLGPNLVYAASVASEIAESIDDCDRAMRWGYGWSLGPFELWDAIGLSRVLDAVPSRTVPPIVCAALDSGRDRLRDPGPPPAAPWNGMLRMAGRGGLVRAGAGATLLDLGDGVLAVDLHSKANAIGPETLDLLELGVREAFRSYSALVIGTDAPDFSAGADLRGLLADAREGEWERIDERIQLFQRVVLSIRYADVPVVIAAWGLALGGACELLLHADRVQAGVELYAGLVETAVGLIPAGGGTKEMLARGVANLPDAGIDLPRFVRAPFDLVRSARRSGSAFEARQMGYLRETDGITVNRDRLMPDAKSVALERVRQGYRPPPRREAIPVGGAGLNATLDLGLHLAQRSGRMTAHEALIGRKLAWVMSGGSLPGRTAVSERYLLELEREAFLSLCGEPKTQERIAHTLETGKTLRN